MLTDSTRWPPILLRRTSGEVWGKFVSGVGFYVNGVKLLGEDISVSSIPPTPTRACRLSKYTTTPENSAIIVVDARSC